MWVKQPTAYDFYVDCHDNDPLYYYEGIKSDFASLVFNKMLELHISRKDLASKTGYSKKKIKKILGGNCNITSKMMAKILFALGSCLILDTTNIIPIKDSLIFPKLYRNLTEEVFDNACSENDEPCQ
jgi:transcriptional regulator with XRE-family HTH domain